MARSRKTHAHRQHQYWIGYCRKSTDSEDKQVHTLQDQAAMIEAYYSRLPPEDRRHSLQILQEARSAYRPGRPVFQTLLRLADAGEVRGVIVVHPNRVSRNHADSGSFVQRLVDGTIRSLDATGGKRYTGADSNDIFMLTLEGAMSWKDSRDKGDRIREAMRMRAQEGKLMGQARLGYRHVSRPDGTRVLEVVPEVAAHLRRLFDLAASGGLSVQALAREARALGLRSRNGKELAPSAVHSILRDPLYKGDVRFSGIVARGRHTPLVDGELWGRVQEALSGRRRYAGQPKDRSLREHFVFGSLLRCPRCGRVLSPYRAKGRYTYYECKNPHTRCRVLAKQESLVEQMRLLTDAVLPAAGELESMRSALLRGREDGGEEDRSQKDALAAEHARLCGDIAGLFAQRAEAEARGLLDVVDGRLDELRAQRDELRRRLAPAPEPEGDLGETSTRGFTLFELLREAMFLGSARSRELALRAVASNYTVEGGKLVPDWRPPFSQSARRHDHPVWYTGLYAVRTEIEETVALLEAAYLQRNLPPLMSA